MLANGTLVEGINVPSLSEPRQARRSAPLERERDFAAENFYTISTDTHIDDLVITGLRRLGGAHKYAARTVHFEALLDQNRLVAGRDAVAHHPGGAASGRRAGGRISPLWKIMRAWSEPSDRRFRGVTQ